MRLVSFDPFRTVGLPGVRVLKPGEWLSHLDLLREADWVLFPEHWQLNALEYGLGARVFPSPASYRIGHDKVEQTRAFLSVAPDAVPTTHVAANDEPQRRRLWDELLPPFVGKLPKASQGDGVFLIESRADWEAYCARSDVLYAQELLPIDRDLRLTVIGEQVVDAYWRVRARGFHNNVAKGAAMDDTTPVPPVAVELVERVARVLGVDHAGFDVALVGGRPYLLEFNRLFGTLGRPVERFAAAMLAHLRAALEPVDPDQPLRPLPTVPRAA